MTGLPVTGEHALVLGGGGVAGIAWTTGLLTGLAEAGDDVTGADLIIGTSAGANVAAQLGSGLPLTDLFARQADPARQSAEILAELDLAKLAAELGGYLAGASTPAETLRRIGAYALATQTVPEAVRRNVIEGRLPAHSWPAQRIQLTAVDAATGELRVFDSASGASLVDAVAASSAVPGIWPPVTIGASRYVDGGVRSADNADLAAGFGRITVISPIGFDSLIPSSLPLREVVAKLQADGSAVTVIVPDAASATAIGTNALDPATRTPAATAGLAQGRAGLTANNSVTG
ncbi:MAG TPA: patatin-like phospholipase family protein [Streptosporangiaceae bacterium]|nr:patatin-like phospholipase family protein [Streptosporangiaceae bacterium]